jgi:hypothetical protein
VAREVILKTWCDPHLDQGEHVEGQELPPLLLPDLPGRQAVTMAVCDVHRKELYEPLVDALREFGQHVDDEGNPTGPRGRYKKAEKPARKYNETVEGGVKCPACEHRSPNVPALSSHARNTHDSTIAELEGKPTPYACPECPEDRPKSFATPQALGAHRARMHGVKGTSKDAKRRAHTEENEA